MKRFRWWQSIRWRLALGSALLALLTTTLLALTAMFVISNYYLADQKTRLENFARDKAQSISTSYEHNKNFSRAVNVIQRPALRKSDPNQGIQVVVLNRNRNVIYPGGVIFNRRGSGPDGALLPGEQILVLRTVLEFIDPGVQNNDAKLFASAIVKARQGEEADGSFARDTPVGSPQPFVVEPIFAADQNGGMQYVVGMLIVTTAPNTIPSFVKTVGAAVFVASLALAVLAALVAIFFAQTITRPLVKLTQASRVLTSGNYDAQVITEASGEIGELAQTFNEMAAQLKRDVEELRRQEIWRRELIMNITHDLATPLTAIAGLGEALVDGINQSHDDYEATGRIIIRETLRLRRLVQDLHVMAKVEAGALEPKRKPLRLAALVDEVFAVMIAEFERHQVEPNNAIPFNLPVIEADPDMLTRIFSNLCNNALHHTPADGSITIDAQQQGDWLHVSVTDTGDGIPEQALSRVFERFYRADSARQSTTGGSGLGLAIVRAIVEAHGGTVWAENAPGAGARISFTLPLGSGASDEPTQPLSAQEINAAYRQHLEQTMP